MADDEVDRLEALFSGGGFAGTPARGSRSGVLHGETPFRDTGIADDHGFGVDQDTMAEIDALNASMDDPDPVPVEDLMGDLAELAEGTDMRDTRLRGAERRRDLYGAFGGDLIASREAQADRPAKSRKVIVPTEEDMEEVLVVDQALALPDGVEPIPFVVIVSFELNCPIDLKNVSFQIRTAEYNPRKHSCLTVRLVGEVNSTASVRDTGHCSMSANVKSWEEVEKVKFQAKKLAKLIMIHDHPNVKLTSYQINTINCKVNCDFPIDLGKMAMEWRKHAVYEPEVYSGAVFKLGNPKYVYNVTAGGRMTLSGLRSRAEAEDALKRIYPVVSGCQNAPATYLK